MAIGEMYCNYCTVRVQNDARTNEGMPNNPCFSIFTGTVDDETVGVDAESGSEKGSLGMLYS